MSYILDALNKAEHERRLGDVPHLHAQARVTALRTETHTPRSTMALLVGLALLIVISALLVWLRPWASDSIYTLTIRTTKPDPTLQATPATPAVMRAAPPLLAPQETTFAQLVPAAPAERPATAAARPATPPVAAPVLSTSAASGLAPPAANPPLAAPSVAAPPAAIPPIAARPVTAPPAVSQRSSVETMPTLRDLPQNIQQQIPALTVSGYIYAEQPADRSIIINQKFAREGEQVAPELQLERLTQNGMILNFRGYRYRAPY